MDRRSAAVAVLRIVHQFRQWQVAHFLQSRQINLRIDLSSDQRNVAEMIGYLLERNSFRQKMGGAGMPKRMGSVGYGQDPQPMQTLVHHRAKPTSTECSIRLNDRQEDLSPLGAGPHLAEIPQNRGTDLVDEWIMLTLALLRAADVDDLPFPVNIFKAEMAYLPAAQTVNSDR